MELYNKVITFINRRTHFTDADICEFQQLADEYGAKWREVAGRDGQTNYEHFIWSGHLSYYLYKYGNLYMFSQQGFEAMMSHVKCIYHKCTLRSGNGSEVRSHVLQICHFLMQYMLWISGHGKTYFKAKYKDETLCPRDNLFVNY